MAAVNYYVGAKRGSGLNPDLLTVGTSTGGTGVDVEVRMQINNGSTATGLTKLDVLNILCAIEKYIESNGFANDGANIPAI